MKAKEYVERYASEPTERAETIICVNLIQEGKNIAVLRKCQGGSGTDSTFGTYCECFREQWVKWLAVCKRRPEMNRVRFLELLEEDQFIVYDFLRRLGVFRR